MPRRLRPRIGLPGRLSASRVLSFGLALALAAIVTVSPFVARPALALGVIIEVTTATDSEAADGFCSLREAIHASNGGGYLDCDGATSGSDSIRFNIGTGTPVINVIGEMPKLTAPVTINGKTGGADRVRLHGQGAGTGLDVLGSGSFIRNVVIDGFIQGIIVEASGVTITGNILGPNVSYGIEGRAAANVQIGGTNGVTAGGPCTGDCNAISGNSTGISLDGGNGAVQGNFIGTNAAGTVASANTRGITQSNGTWTIGGTAAGAGNVVSGNTGTGIALNTCVCTIQGNRIGTNAAGTAALPNGGIGIDWDRGSGALGGSTPSSGNIISGNLADGVELSQTDALPVQGNRIGVDALGHALGNAGDGMYVWGDAEDTLIGSANDANAANTIAYNGAAGVRIYGPGTKYNQVRGNSIHHNGGSGINNNDSGQDIATPVITGVGPVHGTACAGCAVDVYSDSADEGRTFEGTVTADGGGLWSFPSAVSGPNVTATATNATNSTSEFAAAVAVPSPKKPDGRIRKGSGSLVGNNIYNTSGINQTKTGSTTRGNTITFNISIQNDASSDKFTVQATGTSTSLYSVTYFRSSTDITAAVVAGTYTTQTVGAGGTVLITAKVKVNSTATAGSSITRLVTITSVGDGSKEDAVKFIGKRS